MLELAQSPHVGGLQGPEVLPPAVDRLRAYAVLLRHLWDWPAIGFPQDRHHLLFAESGLLHGSLLDPEGAILSSFSWSEIRRAGHTLSRPSVEKR